MEPSNTDQFYQLRVASASSIQWTVQNPQSSYLYNQTMQGVPPDMSGVSFSTMPAGPSDTMPVGPHPTMPGVSLHTMPVGPQPTMPGVPLQTIPVDPHSTMAGVPLQTMPVDPHPTMPGLPLQTMPVGPHPTVGHPVGLPVGLPRMLGVPFPAMHAGPFSNVHEDRTSMYNQMNEEQSPKDLSNQYENVSEPGDEENQTQATGEPSRSTESKKVKEKVLNVKEKVFIAKVHFLMNAFGDANHPLNKSVLLMYNLLKSQMILLIGYCEDIVKRREMKKITHEELLFLMRKNKALLRRLLQFLYVKDCGNHVLPGFEEYRGTKMIPTERKTVHKCLEYLSFIENYTGELTSIFCDKKVFDSVLQKRLERRYLIQTSSDIYLQNWFKSTLRISLNDYAVELQELTTFDITSIAVWIIEFLALETVAGLVEKALYLRSRKWEEKNFKIFPHLDFSRSTLQFDDSDKDLLDDDAATPDVNFSFFPRKYLKEKNSFENNDQKTSNDETFYEDSVLTVLPKVVSFPTDFKPKYLPRDFIKRSGHPPLKILMRKDSGKELIPKNPITPSEIEAAFIHYQRPLPITLLMKPKHPYAEKRKTKLICLALPIEEFEEET